jgi:hypothetical protein
MKVVAAAGEGQPRDAFADRRPPEGAPQPLSPGADVGGGKGGEPSQSWRRCGRGEPSRSRQRCAWRWLSVSERWATCGPRMGSPRLASLSGDHEHVSYVVRPGVATLYTFLCVYMCMCKYVCVCVCVCACVCVYICTHTYIYTHVYMPIHMCVCMYIHMRRAAGHDAESGGALRRIPSRFSWSCGAPRALEGHLERARERTHARTHPQTRAQTQTHTPRSYCFLRELKFVL